MRILFIRHGEPNYELDCLTPTGRRQAAAAAERLASEGILEIYASPMGRAAQTAGFTAERLGLPVRTLEFMHEITWGGPGIPENGHPWTLSDRMIEEGFDFYAAPWREHPYFKGNAAVADLDRVSAEFDALLSGYGYRREGGRLLCRGGSDATIAVFSHGGSGACVLASLLALPFPYVLSVMPYDFTSVIAVELPVREGEYVRPRLELFNDCAHIRDTASGPQFQETPDR